MELNEFETLLKDAIKNKTIENCHIIKGIIKFNFTASNESICPNTNFSVELYDSFIKVMADPTLKSKENIIATNHNDKSEYIDLINLIRNEYYFYEK